MKELLINEQIKADTMILILDDGKKLDNVSRSEALRISEDRGLDLCLVNAPKEGLPICKLMDYGKYCYEQQKKDKDAKKKQKVIEIKEIKLSAVIDVGDLNRLAAQSVKFIKDGNKVKASIRLRGRQNARPEIAMDIIKDYISKVGEVAIVEKQPVQEKNNIFTILAPAPTKK